LTRALFSRATRHPVVLVLVVVAAAEQQQQQQQQQQQDKFTARCNEVGEEELKRQSDSRHYQKKFGLAQEELVASAPLPSLPPLTPPDGHVLSLARRTDPPLFPAYL
jgi:hypothetical protein